MVSGGTGVLGRAAVRALVGGGHDVVVLIRRPENAEVAGALGADTVPGDLLSADSLADAYAGADAVVSLATHVPIGYAAAWPGAWRRNDELRTQGVANVVAAATRAGVRRIVQESVSLVYADAGDKWVRESDPIEITSATEPVAVAESQVQHYCCDSRTGVILRFGMIIGADPTTRSLLRAAARGRPIGLGSPQSWNHVVHTDDLGSAVLASLHAPSGVYNVGAGPVRRSDLIAAYADHAGGPEGLFFGPLMKRLAGPRMEPMTRSLRVSSDHFAAQTGWRPTRPVFSPAWFDVAMEMEEAR